MARSVQASRSRRGLLLLGLLLGLALAVGCQRPPCCTSDEQCAAGFACHAGSCRPRCSFVGQCSVGQRCDTDLRVCVGGTVRPSCPEAVDAGPSRDGSFADRGLTDLGPLDSAASDRLWGEGGGDVDISDRLWGRDRAADDARQGDASIDDKPPVDGVGVEGPRACAEDVFEPNDVVEQATAIAGAPVDAVLCPGDVDFYAVQRGMSAAVTATLSCENASAPLRMILRMPTGARQVRTCDPAQGSVQASLTVPEPGAATIEVAADDNLLLPYRLEAVAEGATWPCGYDSFEPNEDPDTAATIRYGARLTAGICAGDVDVYALPMSAGALLQASVATSQANPGAVLELLAPDGSTLLDLAVVTSSSAQVQAVVQRAGNHYLRLSEARQESYYTLRVGEHSCADDGFEDNDQVATATAVDSGPLEAIVCPGDRDFFALDITEARPLRLDLRFLHRVGDLDLALYNSRDQRVGLSQGVGDVEVIQYQPAQAGRLTAEVYGFNQAQGAYSLDLCIDDVYEDNDRLDRATPIPLADFEAMLCRGDSDHWAVDLIGPMALDVSLSLVSMGVVLDMRLLRARDGAVLASAFPSDSGYGLHYVLGDGQERVVIVVDNTPQSAGYRLRVQTSTD